MSRCLTLLRRFVRNLLLIIGSSEEVTGGVREGGREGVRAGLSQLTLGGKAAVSSGRITDAGGFSGFSVRKIMPPLSVWNSGRPSRTEMSK